jgi:hypothetical protein
MTKAQKLAEFGKVEFMNAADIVLARVNYKGGLTINAYEIQPPDIPRLIAWLREMFEEDGDA